jgi:hypothetical protein
MAQQDLGCADAVEKEDGSGWAVVQPPVIGRPRWRRQQQSGGEVWEHAAAVERKADGKRGREGGVREPRLSWSWSRRVIFLICGNWRRAEGADRNGLLDVRSTNRGFWRGWTFDSQHYRSLIP